MTRAKTPGGERGASLLELAFIVPVLALVVMGTLDLVRGYRLQIELSNAAREGAAFAQLAPNDVSCSPGDDITERVLAENADLSSLPGFEIAVFEEDGAGEPTVPVTGCGTGSASSGERVLVEVSADHQILTPMVERIVGSTIRITGASEVEVQG